MKKGFHSKKLGDVCDVLTRGISPKYMEDGGICVLNQKCIRNHAVSFEPSRRHDVSIKNVPDERFVQLGDVLVNSTGTGTLGRVAQIRDLLPEQTTVDSHVTIVRPNKTLFHLDFFGYAMIMIEEEIKNAGEGCGGQTELARSTLAEKFFVRFPEDANEQKRIVNILDESFKAIDIAKANTENNLKNARALFESFVNDIFSKQGDGWKRVQLNKVAEIIMGQSPKGDTYNKDGKGLPLINGPVEFTKDSFGETIKDRFTNAPTKICEKGDLILCVRGSTTGRMNIAGFRGCIGRGVAAIRAKEVPQKWINYFFNGKRSEIYEMGTGATFPNVSGSMLSKMVISIAFPSMIEKYINQMETVRENTNKLESIYQKKLTTLEELKKSLLHEAFNGGL